MTAALIAVVVVALVAIGLLLEALRRARAEADRGRDQVTGLQRQVADATRTLTDAEQRAEDAAAEAGAERLRADEAGDRAARAEGELALARQSSLPASAPSDRSAEFESLWALALLEQERAWRLTMALPAGDSGLAHARGLVEVVDAEIARIREETGTPGRLYPSVALEPTAGEAVVALRAVQVLLAAVIRYSDAFDLYLSSDDGGLAATLVCENFDGPDSVAEDASALYRAVAPAGGAVDIDRDDEGRLQAHLHLPTH